MNKLWCAVYSHKGKLYTSSLNFWDLGLHSYFIFLHGVGRGDVPAAAALRSHSHLLSKVAQSCLTLCDPTDCSLPGSSIHGIFQARVLQWVGCCFLLQRIFWPRDQTQISHIVGRRLYHLSHQESPSMILSWIQNLGPDINAKVIICLAQPPPHKWPTDYLISKLPLINSISTEPQRTLNLFIYLA